MRVAIIGAGLSGLSCGIHLLSKGYDVTIYEKNGHAGGRANVVDEMGYKIDMGPTLLLMPEVLQGIFEMTGRKLSDYVTIKRLTPGYGIQFGDGRVFEMTDDMTTMVKQIRAVSPDLEKQFFRYITDTQNKFTYSKSVFIERNFESLLDMVNLESLKSFFKIKPFGNAYEHVFRIFKNDYLATALSCQCLYLGQSPLKTPALYNLLAYLEFTYGVWFPMGGMRQIPLALAKLFGELGGVIEYNTPVASVLVERGQAKGVCLQDGTVELTDLVVSNRDLPASYENFIASKDRPRTSSARIRKWHYGCSAVMFYLGLKRNLKGLRHHMIYLSEDYQQALKQIFEDRVLADDPLLYVCSPTQTDPSLAPEGKAALYILALAPNLDSQVDWERELPAFKDRVYGRLRRGGVALEPELIEMERIFTPKDFESTYGNYFGNAFGLAPDFFQSACFRPANKSKDVKHFYHTGASTHPGGGIPMVLISGRLVADQIAKDFQYAHTNSRIPATH